ncbi:hypothetical protein F2Q69_00061977 [Brassica cretica]|uniref:Enhanced disease resistance 4-like N-terminal domain-containing protein n=1 Tax=Brassica cretica TaxID=69181 RepID=A0A8S9RJP2_BRACR|nr:hypothetical protein F2Q69_00061977 [Brassica cretica]
MMVKKEKKQSRSQSSTEKKTLELSIFSSKLASGRDKKHMLRGMSSKPAPGLSCQSRVVRCPKCHKLLQAPVDVTIYTCSECHSIPQAKRLEQENNDKSIPPEDHLLPCQNRSLTPIRSTYRKYSSRASSSPCFERGDAFASARSCSGVVKLSITKKEDATTTTLFDLLRLVDSGTSVAEDTVVIDIHISSSSDKGSGDRITDAVNVETKGIKERDTRRSISSEFYDLKLEAFQPSSSVNTRKESAQGGGGSGSITPVRSSYRKYSSRASPPLFERGNYHSETASYIRREWMTRATPSPYSYGYTSSPFHGSSAAASPVRFQGETSDQKYYHWSSQQSRMHLQIVIIQTRAPEIEDDKGIKEEIRSISSKFIDLTFQRQWNHKLRAQASLLGDGGSGEIHEEQSKHEYENISKRQELLEERAGLHLEEYETNYEDNYSNPFEWMTPTFHVPEYEPDEEEPWLVDDNKTKELQVVGVVVEDGASLHLEKFENEKTLLDQPREDIFRLSLDDTLEQEWVTFDLETSQEVIVNLRQTFKQGDTEENTPTSEKENEKSGRTSEVVGLRHTLYQTQTSPLSTLPIDTPIGSPRHILMRSPMHSHIVSPLRSPTNSSGSLSDVLSLAK